MKENGHGGKRAPVGCPLKCGAAKLPDDKEILIKHLLTYCNRMPIKCQLCDLVFTKNEFYGCFDNPEQESAGHLNVCKAKAMNEMIK